MKKFDLIGMRVMNTQTKSIGRIEKIEDGYLFISFHGDLVRFPFPACFTTTLELEDEALQEELEAESADSSFDAFKIKYRSAVSNEINYLRATGGKKYRAIDGELLPSQNGETIYAFDTDTDLHFPDGTAIKIWFPEKIIPAYVVSCEEFTLVIRTLENLGNSINMIEFTAEQWQLLESLVERIDEMSPQSESIAYEVACKGRNQINKNKGVTCGQNFAYRRATSEKVTFIWGPPGTGKTETLANIALDHIEQNKRVLMLSYSNVSVDGALLRVAKKYDCDEGVIVRYGYPRAKELVEDNRNLTSYQCVLNKNPKLAKEYQELTSLKKKLKKKSPERITITRKLAQIREKLLLEEKELIQNAMFVATTVSKAVVDRTIYTQKFDVVIFDEASMAYVPQVVFAASLSKHHFVCLGDFCQLPAIVQNNTDDRLAEDIFHYTRITEAVENGWGHNWLIMLNVQYRMHRDIANVVNKYMYGGRLETSDEIYASRNEIAACEPMSNAAISMVDLSHTYSVCTKTMDGSRINLLSAMVCMKLAESYLNQYEVGIITPYSAQARLILSMIRDMKEKDKRYSQLTRAKGKFILVANRDFMYRKNISNKLIFTKVMDSIKKNNASLGGDEIIKYLSSNNKKRVAIYFDSREDSFDKFCKDLEAATKRIQIEIPGIIDEDDDALEQLCMILNNKEGEGVDVTIRLDEDLILPEELQKFARYGYTTTPVTLIDNTIIWFGHPISAAEFFSEGELLETESFPCARFEGYITGRSLQAFLEI
ncbi:MAG: hypothetical protein E7282_10970 [Lachnospiraceae bacterium]|nr:hypothetical protein [Lachnospiraceae bacterium]